MEAREKAVRLVSYIRRLEDFAIVDYIDGQYGHMGATIADAILQAGTRYDTVVRPRVREIRNAYPEAGTTSGFWRLIEKEGAKRVLRWRHDEKPNRVIALTRFLLNERIETEDDLAVWLGDEANRPRLLELRGIGPKTADYLKILVGIQTAAADRYVFRLLEEADAAAADYQEAKEILNFAADAMGVERAVLDHGVWQYMSKRGRRRAEPRSRGKE
jgi:endonuclease III